MTDIDTNATTPAGPRLLPIDLRDTAASLHLDVIRALAAFAVLIYHVRYRFFLDYSDLQSTSLSTKVFYFLTSFGHDAVMVFFVLSGFLISGSILREQHLGRFAWRRYAMNRLTRLYVVLIPGLLLTLLWDRLGLAMFPTNAIYSGQAAGWKNDYFDVASRLTVWIGMKNLLFLQTISAPPFGSNDPLWSLAYEFWYYLLFPIVYVSVLHGRSWQERLAGIVAAALVVQFVSVSILLYFPIWLLGTALCVLPQSRLLRRPAAFRTAVVAAGLVCAAALVAGHLAGVRSCVGNSVVATDYLSAAGFALFLYVVLHDHRRMTEGRYATISVLAAGFSYTLYVVHMPLLVFLRAAIIPDRPWEPSPIHYGVATLLTLVSLVYAFVVSRATEARTAEIREFLLRGASRLGIAI